MSLPTNYTESMDLLRSATVGFFAWVLITAMIITPFLIRDCRLRRRQHHEAQLLHRRLLDAVAFKAAPVKTSTESTECPICLETVSHPVQIICGHCFHQKCILTWLKEKPSCPTCRNNILETV